MPGFDKTGPQGLGPMTGGGFGLCGTGTRSSVQDGPYLRGAGRGGIPRGGGRGRAWGGGRGRNFGNQTGKKLRDNFPKKSYLYLQILQENIQPGNGLLQNQET